MNEAILVASSNGKIGLPAAMQILRAGGAALDAIIVRTRLVEANPDDHTVGYSGLPNMLGEVELDASVMEGAGLKSGAVGALRGYQDAVDLARKVMESLPHVLIAGEGARKLAEEFGFEQRNLLTPEAEAIWSKRLADPSDRDASYLS